MITMAKHTNKPMIETLINSTALSLTPIGVLQLLDGNVWGYILITFGVGLEFFKYWGRSKKYW